MEINRKAVAFVRTATQEQNKDSESIQLQIQQLTLFAKRQKMELVRVFKLVGKTNQQLLKILRYCQKNDIKFVLVTGPDRISKNQEEVIYWQLEFDRFDIRFQTPRKTTGKFGFRPSIYYKKTGTEYIYQPFER